MKKIGIFMIITTFILTGCAGNLQHKEVKSETKMIGAISKKITENIKKQDTIDISLKTITSQSDKASLFYIQEDTNGNIKVPGFIETPEAPYDQYFINNKMYYYVKEKDALYPDKKITAKDMKNVSIEIREGFSQYFAEKLNLCAKNKEKVTSKHGKYTVECSNKDDGYGNKVDVDIVIDQETYDYTLETKTKKEGIKKPEKAVMTYRNQPKKEIKLPKANHKSIDEFSTYFKEKREEQLTKTREGKQGTSERITEEGDEKKAEEVSGYAYEGTLEKGIPAFAEVLGYFPNIIYVSEGKMYVERTQVKGTIEQTLKTIDDSSVILTYGVYNGEHTSGTPVRIIAQEVK